jgi:hypothetical protein
MNFTFTWIMDKLGYMPKVDMQVGKVDLDVAVPDLSKPRVRKTRALPSKATVVKTTVRTARAKKAK